MGVNEKPKAGQKGRHPCTLSSPTKSKHQWIDMGTTETGATHRPRRLVSSSPCTGGHQDSPTLKRQVWLPAGGVISSSSTNEGVVEDKTTRSLNQPSSLTSRSPKLVETPATVAGILNAAAAADAEEQGGGVGILEICATDNVLVTEEDGCQACGREPTTSDPSPSSLNELQSPSIRSSEGPSITPSHSPGGCLRVFISPQQNSHFRLMEYESNSSRVKNSYEELSPKILAISEEDQQTNTRRRLIKDPTSTVGWPKPRIKSPYKPCRNSFSASLEAAMNASSNFPIKTKIPSDKYDSTSTKGPASPYSRRRPPGCNPVPLLKIPQCRSSHREVRRGAASPQNAVRGRAEPLCRQPSQLGELNPLPPSSSLIDDEWLQVRTMQIHTIEYESGW